MLARAPDRLGHRLRGLALASTIFAASCGTAAEAPRPHNVLLVTIDTLRADHLGAYGYERPTSPELDAFARTAVVFDGAHSSSSWTLPGVASLMTGYYTSTHRCWNGRSSLAPSFATLAEALGEAGYRTGAVVSHVFLDPRYGLDQGFEDYDDELVHATKEDSHTAISSPAITDKALGWLAERGDEPWFLWVHYFDPHEVYQAHAGFSERFGVERPVDLYDGEIAFTDHHVGRLLDGLDELGLARSTIVALTSDHGEEFGDHGGTGHRATLHAEVQRVPLMIRAPDHAPRRDTSIVSLVDVAPTLLELTGSAPLPNTAGRSLAPLLRGASVAPTPVIGELGMNVVMHESVIAQDWKLIVDAVEERVLLFDLAADPTEQHDLSAAHPQRVEALRHELRLATEAATVLGRAHPAGDYVQPLTPRDLEALRNLGYVEDE